MICAIAFLGGFAIGFVIGYRRGSTATYLEVTKDMLSKMVDGK